jgi:rubrerythrin
MSSTVDQIFEAGYMLPQSENTKKFLQALLEQKQSEGFPKEIVEKLLNDSNKKEEDDTMSVNKTQENLMAAFAGESQANRKYMAYAQKAEKEGKLNAAKLFRAAADAETLHALKHFEVAGKIGSTADNLFIISALSAEISRNFSLKNAVSAVLRVKSLLNIRLLMELDPDEEKFYAEGTGEIENAVVRGFLPLTTSFMTEV